MIWLTISNSKIITWWWALYCFWSRYVVMFCNSLFYFLYNLFLESNFVLWSDGSIQLCQFNFHSWQFDRLFVPKLVYHETLFLQLKILSKLDGTEQIFEKKSQVPLISKRFLYLNCIQNTHILISSLHSTIHKTLLTPFSFCHLNIELESSLHVDLLGLGSPTAPLQCM